MLHLHNLGSKYKRSILQFDTDLMIVFDHTNDLVWLRYTSHVFKKITLYAEVARPFKHYFGRLEPSRERERERERESQARTHTGKPIQQLLQDRHFAQSCHII